MSLKLTLFGFPGPVRQYRIQTLRDESQVPNRVHESVPDLLRLFPQAILVVQWPVLAPLLGHQMLNCELASCHKLILGFRTSQRIF